MTIEKKLRFAPLIRVSTESAGKKGESLNTQTKNIIRDVESLGGVIPDSCWKYRGQEHATGIQERRMLDQLLNDSANDLFDAVIVDDPSRWSRENLKSEEGLKVLKDNGIRFFVRTKEFDLFEPKDRMFLAFNAVLHQYQADEQSKKATINRIERAKKNIPTGGELPFGRTYDKKTGKWGIDPEKKKLAEVAADQYLKGGNLRKLAKKLGVEYTTLLKNLKERCGDTWPLYFDVPRFKIKETVHLKVPRLLPEEIIQAVRAKAESNKTVTHGQYKNQYLLGRMVICGHCGEALSGQPCRNNNRYYRHRSGGNCTAFSSVKAEPLEEAVLAYVFSTFGDKQKIEEAALAAVPNLEQTTKAIEQKKTLEAIKDQVAAEKSNIVKSIAKGILSDEEAAQHMQDLREREIALTSDIQEINARLENVPDEKTTKQKAELLYGIVQRYYKNVHHLKEMTFDEKRALLQSVFSGRDVDGNRYGVYIKKMEGRVEFTIKGNLLDETDYLPMSPEIRGLILRETEVELGYKQNRGVQGQCRRGLGRPDAAQFAKLADRGAGQAPQ